MLFLRDQPQRNFLKKKGGKSKEQNGFVFRQQKQRT